MNEKVGRIPWIGNKSHVRLFALWQDKKGFIYGTLMCSLPFSPGERDTTTLWMAIAFSLCQGPDKTLPEAQRTQGIASKLELSLQLMVAPLALVPNLATRWRHLHELKNWPQDGATCISCMSWKIGHQMAPLALVPNLATRWRHLHWLQIWPPDGTTCISWLHQILGNQISSIS